MDMLEKWGAVMCALFFQLVLFGLAHDIYEGIQMIPIEIGHDLNDIAHFIVQDIVQ